jgi:phage terminase large subunit GpA-like protein
MEHQVARITAGWWGILRPPPKQTIAEWADKELRLSAEASAEPGRFRSSRAMYQGEIMAAVSDPNVHTVVCMTSAQVGKTTIVLAVIGFHMDQDPAPILCLQPTLDMGQAFSKDRLAPMIRDTPVLSGKVRDPRSRDSGNTLLHKTFPGGHITIAGANSAASLASRPIRILLADEVDRYPDSAGTEGDPVSLAKKRTATFFNRKIVMTSTPTVKGASRIEAAFEESDKRYYYVPCPDCDHEQRLVWSQVRWTDGDPNTAEYCCVECGTLWNDAARWQSVRKGRWIASAKSNGVAGFHLSELYSPWRRLSETVEDFLLSKNNPERLRTWVNTSLGETWEEDGEAADATAIDRLRESYGPEDLPEEVVFATAGIDTQGDRLEVEILGWGSEERSWGIEYHVLYGDPAQEPVWKDLDAILQTTYRTASGRLVRVAATAVDSGGHHAEAVLRFCRTRLRRRVYPIKGFGGAGKPIWPLRASNSKMGKIFMVGVDTAKDAILARWGIEEGPGSCRLPADPSLGYDEDWITQVTAEQRVTQYKLGRPYTQWILPSGKRNEALDCRVYAMAAMKSLPRIPTTTQRSPPQTQQQKQQKQRGSSNNWLNVGGSWL